MKKMIFGIIIGVFLTFATSVSAADVAKQISLIVNGKAYAGDVQPQVINGTTMVPLRYIAESLGAKVTWDQSTQTVTVSTYGASTTVPLPTPVVTLNPAPVLTTGPIPVPAPSTPLTSGSVVYNGTVINNNTVINGNGGTVSNNVNTQAPASTSTPSPTQSPESDTSKILRVNQTYTNGDFSIKMYRASVIDNKIYVYFNFENKSNKVYFNQLATNLKYTESSKDVPYFATTKAMVPVYMELDYDYANPPKYAVIHGTPELKWDLSYLNL